MDDLTDIQLEAARNHARSRSLVLGRQCAYSMFSVPYRASIDRLTALEYEQRRRAR